jgi:hypothetical protein
MAAGPTLRKLEFVTEQPAAERLRTAYQQRHESDYIFRFGTAFAWCVLTGGVYSLYVLYQLVRRSRDHNRRRLELLEAAAAFSWEQAQARGLTDDLRPEFERVAQQMRVLGGLTNAFREPALWVVLTLVTGSIAQYVAWILLDRDLVRHEEAEREIESDLGAIYARLGRPITDVDLSPPKGRHNVVGRIIATIASLGFYAIWWMRDVMNDGNAHFEQNWRFEDDLARASRSLLATQS